MIILLQHTDTLAFADSDGGWAPDRFSAREFETAHNALLFCAAHGLTSVQVLYEFPDPRMNTTTRVSDGYLRRLRDTMSNRPTDGSS